MAYLLHKKKLYLKYFVQQYFVQVLVTNTVPVNPNTNISLDIIKTNKFTLLLVISTKYNILYCFKLHFYSWACTYKCSLTKLK